MQITVRLFAILKDRAGTNQTEIELPENSSVAQAAEILIKKFPSLSKDLPRIAFAKNQEYVSRQTMLNDGDELALIPPVSGGNDSSDLIEITPRPLSIDDVTAHVNDPSAGGIDVFLGVTRAENSSQNQKLLAIDYESYETMAITQLRNLANRARQRWPIVKLAIVHRIGRVNVGEPSVIIAVSTPHRTDAFEACRFLIDQLKVDVAIWKKEIWSDGKSSWVHPV